MTDEPLAEFHLLLAAPDGDAEELDDLTRSLRREMEASEVEEVALTPGGAVPEGAKAGLVTASGELNVTLKPAGLPNILGVLRDWLSRQNQHVEIVATVGNSTFHISASITEVSTIMQALGNLNAPQAAASQGATSVTNQSGGADLNAEEITVGGDVVGRDKVTQIHVEAGATVYFGGVAAPSRPPIEADPSP
jgi:hypothetical protein